MDLDLVKEIRNLPSSNCNLSDEVSKLRELVQKQKELLLAVQCEGSVYCRDVKGVNWFDARDRLLQ